MNEEATRKGCCETGERRSLINERSFLGYVSRVTDTQFRWARQSASWKLFTSRPKNAGDALDASRSRGNKIFSESVCENRIYWFSAAGLHEFRGCRAIFSPFPALLKLFARKLPAISLSQKKKKKKKKQRREEKRIKWIGEITRIARRIKWSRDSVIAKRAALFFSTSIFFPLLLFLLLLLLFHLQFCKKYWVAILRSRGSRLTNHSPRFWEYKGCNVPGSDCLRLVLGRRFYGDRRFPVEGRLHPSFQSEHCHHWIRINENDWRIIMPQTVPGTCSVSFDRWCFWASVYIHSSSF